MENPPTAFAVGGSKGNWMDVRGGLGCNPANPANLGLHSVARGLLRSLPPHCDLAREDPSKSDGSSDFSDLSQP